MTTFTAATAIDTAAISTSLEAVTSRTVYWQGTEDDLDVTPISIPAPSAAIVLEHTGQAGFTDAYRNPVTDWFWRVMITRTYGGGRRTVQFKKVEAPAGTETVNLDELPDEVPPIGGFTREARLDRLLTDAEDVLADAEAARDEALAANWNGSDLAVGTHLDTVLTAGRYRFSTAASTAANGYPKEFGGVLEVLRWGAAAGAVLQRITYVSGSAAVAGIYERRWNQGWNGWKFIPTQQVDQTAGRAIYTWDDLNAREQMIYGDTGWRELPLLNEWAGSVRIRRQGSLVEVAGANLVSGSAVNIAQFGAGFVPSRSVTLTARPAAAGNPVYGTVTSASGILQLATGTALHANSVNATYTTTDPWPTTLPGTAVGSIPV